MVVRAYSVMFSQVSCGSQGSQGLETPSEVSHGLPHAAQAARWAPPQLKGNLGHYTLDTTHSRLPRTSLKLTLTLAFSLTFSHFLSFSLIFSHFLSYSLLIFSISDFSRLVCLARHGPSPVSEWRAAAGGGSRSPGAAAARRRRSPPPARSSSRENQNGNSENQRKTVHLFGSVGCKWRGERMYETYYSKCKL